MELVPKLSMPQMTSTHGAHAILFEWTSRPEMSRLLSCAYRVDGQAAHCSRHVSSVVCFIGHGCCLSRALLL